MSLACGSTCVKYILFIANFVFFLIGLGTVGLGVWALIDDDKILILTEVGDADNFDVVSLIRTGALVLIASGGVAVLIGFLGCCGAVKENNCLLFAYCVVMVVILFVQIAAVVIAAIFQNKVTEDLKVFLKSRLSAQYEGSITTKDPFSLGLDVAQIQFECCGIDNYMDFLSATKWQDQKNASTIIPLTCCRFSNKDAYYSDYNGLILEDPSCETSPSDQNSNFRKGCWDAILEYANDKAIYVIAIGVAIGVVEVLCVVVASCLIQAIRKSDEESSQ
ncbi:tetraspanin-18-like [Saccostrea cucullata]|uniref:tetraspanin-18-like n=1 Tax=Saccostrea cuccullata TaxID=36930 RepID=UPI002ED11EC4